MRMNFGITAQGPQNDFGNALLQGMRLKGLKGEIDQRNALAAAMQQHGAGALSGDQNALNALAAVGPQGFQVASQSRAQHAAEALREREFVARQADMKARLGLAQAAGARAASESAARMSAMERAEAREEAIREGAAAETAYRQGEEAWSTFQDRFPEFENVPHDQAPIVIASITGAAFEFENYTPKTDLGQANADLEHGAITDEQHAQITAPPGPDFDVEQDLRKEFTGLPQVSSFQKQVSAFGSIAESAADPSAAGDLALIFGYMKMLDPDSAVRETEFANAQNAGGIPDVIRAQWNKLKRGERLSETQRSDFLNRAERLYSAAEAKYSDLESQYSTIATGQGVDPSRAFPDYRYKPRNSSKPVIEIDGYTIEAID